MNRNGWQLSAIFYGVNSLRVSCHRKKNRGIFAPFRGKKRKLFFKIPNNYKN